jgi:hypothetical protein
MEMLNKVKQVLFALLCQKSILAWFNISEYPLFA